MVKYMGVMKTTGEAKTSYSVGFRCCCINRWGVAKIENIKRWLATPYDQVEMIKISSKNREKWERGDRNQ